MTDRTEYDDNFEQLLARADRTKLWTEKLTSHVETVLQPNPSKKIFFLMTIKINALLILDERLEDFILTKLDQKSLNKANIYEQLGHCMCEAGNDFGPSTQYGIKIKQNQHFLLYVLYSGSTLIKCGHSHQKLGQVHKEFVQSAANGFMQPLKSFLDGEMKSLTVK